MQPHQASGEPKLSRAKAFDAIAAFLAEIGILSISQPGSHGFLPGLYIRGETIFYDRRKAHPGDLLHEAGHIAVVPAMFRRHIDNGMDRLQDIYNAWFAAHPSAMSHPEHRIARAILQAGEQEAIAWSWAAGQAIGLPSEMIFRRDAFTGGRGSERALIFMCQTGRHGGVHGLTHAGMGRRNEWPRLRRWLQA